jgi:hypothetical protein
MGEVVEAEAAGAVDVAGAAVVIALAGEAPTAGEATLSFQSVGMYWHATSLKVYILPVADPAAALSQGFGGDTDAIVASYLAAGDHGRLSIICRYQGRECDNDFLRVGAICVDRME